MRVGRRRPTGAASTVHYRAMNKKKGPELKWLTENDPLETDDVEGVVCMPSRNFHIEKFLIENYFTSKLNMREEHWYEDKLNAEIQSDDDVNIQFFTWHQTSKLSMWIPSQFNKFLRLKDQKRPTKNFSLKLKRSMKVRVRWLSVRWNGNGITKMNKFRVKVRLTCMHIGEPPNWLGNDRKRFWDFKIHRLSND